MALNLLKTWLHFEGQTLWYLRIDKLLASTPSWCIFVHYIQSKGRSHDVIRGRTAVILSFWTYLSIIPMILTVSLPSHLFLKSTEWWWQWRRQRKIVYRVMGRIFTCAYSVLVLELRIVCALPCSSIAPFKSLSKCLSAHVIEGQWQFMRSFTFLASPVKPSLHFKPHKCFLHCEYLSICSRKCSSLLMQSTLLTKGIGNVPS